MKKETSLGHDIVIITLITLVAGLLLGVVHTVTAGPIARQEEKTRIEADIRFQQSEYIHSSHLTIPEKPAMHSPELRGFFPLRSHSVQDSARP